MSKKTVGALLWAPIIAAAGSAVATLIPSPAPHKNDLGYLSLCPFAPWSTLMLLMVAAVLWVVRSYLLTRADA